MKRTIGSLLIALSIVCMAATVLWMGLGLADMPENPTEDDRTTFAAFLLFAGVLIALETVTFLCGRYLRHPSPERAAEETEKRSRTRPLPLIVYLTGSMGIAILASLGTRVLPQIKALGFLIGQPGVEKSYPCTRLKDDSEVFVNHRFTDGRDKTVLCGLIYADKATGKTYIQDRGGWIKSQGKGTIVYLMPGHCVPDYQNERIAQMILNAVTWK